MEPKPSPRKAQGKTKSDTKCNDDLTNKLKKETKSITSHLCGGEILLESTLELLLLRRGLESTVTELGGGVDPLEADLLQSLS